MRRFVIAAALALLVPGAAKAGGIPGARYVDHMGVTVPSLDQAIDFFTNVIGCVHVYTAGPFADPKGDWMKVSLNVHPRASLMLAMLRCGPSFNLELFEYQAPDQAKTPPKNSDVGGHHMAIYVTDIDKAVAYLKTVPGVKVLGSPTPVSNQPNGGETFVYFLTPWGMSMELATFEDGMAYEKTTDKRLYGVGMR